jgi:hypothetical protein
MSQSVAGCGAAATKTGVQGGIGSFSRSKTPRSFPLLLVAAGKAMSECTGLQLNQNQAVARWACKVMVELGGPGRINFGPSQPRPRSVSRKAIAARRK